MILNARRRSVVPGGAIGWEVDESWSAGDELGAHWSESGLLEGDELDWSGDAFGGLRGLRRGKLSAASAAAAAAARTKRNYTYEDLYVALCAFTCTRTLNECTWINFVN